jgi:PAS domain-containing protein
MNNDINANSNTAKPRHPVDRRSNWQPAAGVILGEDTLKLLHELQVQHVELEMQNEELRLARSSMELLLQQYTELYDFAPVGYFTLGEDGTILQLNLAGATLLHQHRSELVGQTLGKFVDQTDKAMLKQEYGKL